MIIDCHTHLNRYEDSEPETLAVYADLLTFRPDLVIVLHSTRRHGPFINYDGPAEVHAERFADAAARFDPAWHTRPDMGYATPGYIDFDLMPYGLAQRAEVEAYKNTLMGRLEALVSGHRPGDTPAAVGINPNTIHGWRPISVKIQPKLLPSRPVSGSSTIGASGTATSSAIAAAPNRARVLRAATAE